MAEDATARRAEPTGPFPDTELAEAFAGIARALLEEADLDRTLARICELAVQTIDGCESAGISVVRGRHVESRLSTDDIPGRLDALQAATGEGPCVDAIKERLVFVTGSLSREARWPNFATRAHADTGVESILSFRLFANEHTMGALNLYSTQPDAFDERAEAVGHVFAAHAAVAWANAEHLAQLEAKAAGREVIGIAKGMIAARQNVSDEEAFDVLRKASQRLNIRLREVAEQVARGTRGLAPPTEPPEP